MNPWGNPIYGIDKRKPPKRGTKVQSTGRPIEVLKFIFNGANKGTEFKKQFDKLTPNLFNNTFTHENSYE
ncbi:MAG: hypothetical protein ACRDFB_09265 [Rhabdochlamydiaceae bacterium]